MVKLTINLVSLAPRANNYVIKIIAQNNFAQVEMCIEGTYARSHARTTSVARRPFFLTCSLTLFLDFFVFSAL